MGDRSAVPIPHTCWYNVNTRGHLAKTQILMYDLSSNWNDDVMGVTNDQIDTAGRERAELNPIIATTQAV